MDKDKRKAQERRSEAVSHLEIMDELKQQRHVQSLMVNGIQANSDGIAELRSKVEPILALQENIAAVGRVGKWISRIVIGAGATTAALVIGWESLTGWFKT